MKTNIALIGFMGTGKTAVGCALAEKLGRQFVEMDSLIEQKASKSIADIFQQDGEIAFRELEIEVAREVAQGNNLVIACGGGVILNKINIDRLKEGARVVYLVASPSVILKRVLKGGEKRPLMNVPDRAVAIRELLEFRKPFYERAADITIDTSNLDIDAVAEQIINKLKQDESFNI
ncbi:shikimate kinase [Chloroflexota bacterium]